MAKSSSAAAEGRPPCLPPNAHPAWGMAQRRASRPGGERRGRGSTSGRWRWRWELQPPAGASVLRSSACLRPCAITGDSS